MAREGSEFGGHLGWFLFGALAGAAAALLMAPGPGRETRERLARSDVARRAQELATEAQGRAGEWLDKSREVFEEQSKRLREAFDAGRDAMREEMRRLSGPEER